VTRLLAGTDEKLETIARQTGFADANHLCKVFRRHLQVSPGEYRKQMR
jgi:transcriptional regulator GlxA family with amidase domain